MNRFPEDFRIESGIWLPPQDNSIPYSDGDAAEKYLEQVLNNAADLSNDSPELILAMKDWPSRYHLSPERSNLLRPLGISRESRVLELGCGCGAITRYLGENAGSVTAVEGSPIRAGLARLRCRDLDNVDVIETNFDSIEFEKPFDIVTLIGVLEYAAIFWRNSGDPFEALLRLASRNLAENGVLVIAIENKLGIKYLSGCSEDHLARHFTGVEGYPDDGGPRTFGRAELEDILNRTGFADSELLLPFPDYKIPNTLINSRFTTPAECREYNLVDWCRQPFQDYSREREMLFSDTLALGSMAENGLFSDCANSFLVIAAKGAIGPDSPIRRAEWIARKYNVLRRPAYQTITTLQHQEGIPSINKEFLNGTPSSANQLVQLRVASTASFIKGGTSLSLEMLRVLRGSENVQQRFASLVAAWVQYLRQNLLPGTADLPPRFLDCIPDNLIIDGEGSWNYIDDEWHWSEPVPMEWVIFRGLLGFWLGSRSWIAGSLMPDEYRFGDFLAVALKSSGSAIADKRLESLANLELSFQTAVVATPPVDFQSLLKNTFKERPGWEKTQELRTELKSAHDYTATCISTIKEKDTLIDSLALERADLQRKAQDCGFLKSDNEKLQKQLAVQHQKTGELAALSERLRAEAKASPAPDRNGGPPDLPALDIIIPVYNAFDEVRRCLDSVLRNTDERHRIHIIDDASTDPRVRPFLAAQAERHERIRLIHNERNRGFIRTVNSALAETRDDVIVLNSDTIVTAGWAEKIQAAAMSEPSVGLVCPLSNNATILSVPSMNENNPLPPGISLDQFGRIVEEVSMRRYPRIPTAVGFCMFISRKCINDTGLLDEVFGMGYGEENDFAMRAQEKGYCVKIADDTFVFHSGSTSFKTVSGDLDQRKMDNEKLLGERWPQYHKTILAFCILNPLREVQQRIHDGISRRTSGDKPHIMQVAHSYHTNAGTELHTRQLAEGLSPFYRSTVFFPDSGVVNSDAHSFLGDGNVMELRYARRNLASDILFDSAASSTASVVVETNFERMLRNSDLRIVHFQHLLNFGTFNLPLIAKNLGMRVVLTLHDYFYLCPVYNLVKNNRSAMCRRLGPDVEAEECCACFQDKLTVESKEQSVDLKAFLGAYFHRRCTAIKKALAAADLLIAPSGYVKEKYRQGLGDEIGKRIVVVPHGVAVAERVQSRPRNRQLQVTFLGNATGIKGYEVFGEAARRLKGRPVIMHSYGAGVQELLQRYRHEVKNKGPYKPCDLPEIFQNSDVVVVPSLWEETFCLTMSEAFAHGVPVIASDVGAMSERVLDGKNGFLFPVGDVDRLVDIIKDLMVNPALLSQMKEYCIANPPRSIDDMIEQYRGLYDDLLNNRIDHLEQQRNTLRETALEMDREYAEEIVMDAVGA
jgi:GT2 family glycosyltransferase/glycosyltransferase involved in cell wall biosynthesis/SAM-dependent methyltransferase